MRPFLPLLLLLLLLSFRSTLSVDCPEDCSCPTPDAIFCIHRRAATVPRGLPPSTRELYVFQNGIDTLTQGDFSGLDALEMLDLSQNELTDVPDRSFQTLAALKNLDLSANYVAHVSKDSFSGLVQLERLYLHGNGIQSIHPEAFEGLEMLLELKLQGNRLTTLPYLRLPRLLLLDLSSNSLGSLGPSDLQTPHLESLKVAALKLTSLDEELLSSLVNLHDLDISQNKLLEVPLALRQGTVRGLIKLNLAGNPLRELRAEAFQKLTGLQQLDLSSLNLQGFPQGFLQTFPRLGQLTAAENPFNCLCPLAWFPAWLKERKVELGRSEVTRCHFPPVNAGKMLAELEHRDFGCPPATTALNASFKEERTLGPPGPTSPPGPTNAAPPHVPSEEPSDPEADGHPLPPAPPVSPSSTSEESEEHICPANICLNGGTCRFDPPGQLGCLCPTGTSGLYCENNEEEEDEEATTVDQPLQLPPPPPPPAPPAAAATPTEGSVVAPAMASELDDISSRQVTSTSILLDLHRFIETRPHIRGIKLTYRNLSGPDRRPMYLSVPASYPVYTLRGLRPNCTYSVCASPLGERISPVGGAGAGGAAAPAAGGAGGGAGDAGGSCTEARTDVPPSSKEPRVDNPSSLTYALVPTLAALALVLGVAAVAAAVLCLRRRRRRRAGKEAQLELELGAAPAEPAEPDEEKACLEKGGVSDAKQAEIDRCEAAPASPSSSSFQNGGMEHEVPLMQGQPSNNNVTAFKPSYV